MGQSFLCRNLYFFLDGPLPKENKQWVQNYTVLHNTGGDLISAGGQVASDCHGDTTEPAATRRHLPDDCPLILYLIITLNGVMIPVQDI